MQNFRANPIFSKDLERFGSLSGWLLFRCLPTVLVVAVLLLMLGAARARAEAPLSAVEAGQLLVRGESGKWVPALTQQTRVHLDVAGMIATVTLTQNFSNTTSEWVEGIYAFPLPEQAAVRRMEMQVGERRIVGKIRERAEARRIYSAAKAAGKMVDDDDDDDDVEMETTPKKAKKKKAKKEKKKRKSMESTADDDDEVDEDAKKSAKKAKKDKKKRKSTD